MPLISALAIAKDALGNAAAAAVEAASVEAKAGRGLARPLGEAGLFPARTVHLLQLGEEAAQLAAMSLKAADIHDEQAADRAAHRRAGDTDHHDHDGPGGRRHCRHAAYRAAQPQ
jgi:type II secretory pathway component PulF